MLRRFISILAACLALIATQSAWAVPLLCRAETEERVCDCRHDGTTLAEDDCCTRSERDSMGAPGVALPVPGLVTIRLPEWTVPVPAAATEAAGLSKSAFLDAFPAGASSGTPRFLAFRSLLI